jgi:membrane protein DedA with SNARE-associated domain
LLFFIRLVCYNVDMFGLSSDFPHLFQWIIAHGYLIMFVALLIEGPVVTSAGAFAAKLGYFNIYFVFLLSVLGNLIPDILLYAVGYWGRGRLIDRFGHYLKLDKNKIKHLEALMERHAGKTLFAVKMLPFMAVPGLMAAGLVKMNLKKYITLSTIIIFPTSLVFLLIGYYTGTAYNTWSRNITNGSYLLGGIAVLFIVASYAWKKITAKIANKTETI